MKDHSELHRQIVEFTEPTKRYRFLIYVMHALVELGYITKIECMDPECKHPGQPFNKGARHIHSISIDHIIPVANGGTDLPDNLRIVHLSCNGARAAKAITSEGRKRMGEHVKARWQDPTYRDKMIKRVISEEERAKRSESMRKHWADPENKVKHAASLQRSWDERKAK